MAGQQTSVTLESTITCPACGHRKTETMPTDAVIAERSSGPDPAIAACIARTRRCRVRRCRSVLV